MKSHLLTGVTLINMSAKLRSENRITESVDAVLGGLALLSTAAFFKQMRHFSEPSRIFCSF